MLLNTFGAAAEAEQGFKSRYGLQVHVAAGVRQGASGSAIVAHPEDRTVIASSSWDFCR